MKAVNLLPPELRSASRRVKAPAAPAPERVGGAGPFYVLGALALCVLAMAAYVLAGNTVKQREAELAQVNADNQVATTRAAALKPYGDFQAMAVTRASTVSSLAALRFDWERGLRDVSRALPGEVTLSKFEGSLAQSGGGGSIRSAIAAPAITLTGCTSNQSAVARMLSRLRGVRGVTRVSLAKSTKSDSAGGAGEVVTLPGAGTGAPATPTGPCGKGNRPDFEAVVFFQRSTAGTAPGDTPPTPSASPTPAAGTTSAAAPADSGAPVNASTTPAPTATP